MKGRITRPLCYLGKRKALLLTVFIVIFCYSDTNAQVRTSLLNPNKVFLGAGVNSSSFYNNSITSGLRKTKIGITLQVGASYYLNKNFDLGVNFLYERKGIKSRYEVSYYDPSIDSTNCQCTTSQGLTERNTSADYLIFIPQLKYKFVDNKLLIGVGPYLGSIVKAKTTTTNFWDNSSYSANALDTFKKLDVGLSFPEESEFEFVRNNKCARFCRCNVFGEYRWNYKHSTSTAGRRLRVDHACRLDTQRFCNNTGKNCGRVYRY